MFAEANVLAQTSERIHDSHTEIFKVLGNQTDEVIHALCGFFGMVNEPYKKIEKASENCYEKLRH